MNIDIVVTNTINAIVTQTENYIYLHMLLRLTISVRSLVFQEVSTILLSPISTKHVGIFNKLII